MFENIVNYLATAPLWVLGIILVVFVVASSWLSSLLSSAKSFFKNILVPALTVTIIVAGVFAAIRYPDIAIQVAWVAGGLVALVVVWKIITGIAQSNNGRPKRERKDKQPREGRTQRSTADDPSKPKRNDAPGDEPYRGVTFR